MGSTNQAQQALRFHGGKSFFPEPLDTCFQICNALVRCFKALECQRALCFAEPPDHLENACIIIKLFGV